MHIQIVNINNLEYTRNLINDLFRQTSPYKLRIVDQGSVEEGTTEYFDLMVPFAEVVMNAENVPLNHLWNDFYLTSQDPYLCFLNNDVRIPPNFVSDTIGVFEDEPEVGCVLHITNDKSLPQSWLSYEILTKQIVQGWAFTMRKEVYTLIPEQLKFFGGDDFLFVNMYRKGWKTAMVYSSPIVHYSAKSRKYYPGNREEEASYLRELGIERLPYKYKKDKIGYGY